MHDEDPSTTERLLAERLTILQAITTVAERRDELMEVIGSATDGEAARRAVMDRFGLSDVQAFAVLDLQLRRFADRERRWIRAEADEIRRQMNRL